MKKIILAILFGVFFALPCLATDLEDWYESVKDDYYNFGLIMSITGTSTLENWDTPFYAGIDFVDNQHGFVCQQYNLNGSEGAGYGAGGTQSIFKDEGSQYWSFKASSTIYHYDESYTACYYYNATPSKELVYYVLKEDDDQLSIPYEYNGNPVATFELYPTYPPTGATTTITGGYFAFTGDYILDTTDDKGISLWIGADAEDPANLGYHWTTHLDDTENGEYGRIEVLMANGTYEISYTGIIPEAIQIDENGNARVMAQLFRAPDNTVTTTWVYVTSSDAEIPTFEVPTGNIIFGTSTATGTFDSWVYTVIDIIGTPLKNQASKLYNDFRSKFPFSWAFELKDIWSSTTEAYSGDTGSSTASNFVFALTIPTSTPYLSGMSVNVIDAVGAYEEFGTYFDTFRNIMIYILYIGLITTVFYRVKNFFLSLREED
jgi:hypothetical protein